MLWTPARGAAELLEEFGEEESVRLLVAVLRHEAIPDPGFLHVMHAIAGVNALEIDGPFATAGWREWPETWACRTLGYLGFSSVEAPLIDALGHPHWRVRRTAARSLGWCGTVQCLPSLHGLMEDPDRRVRAQAIISEAMAAKRCASPRNA